MEIGKRIKEQRTKLDLTQEQLAARINVARSTVANWENGRNYPDIQMIVILSETLDLTLDELLKGDQEVVEKISEDTQVRKKQSRKIKYLSVLIVLLIVGGLYFSYQLLAKNDTVSDPKQIEKIEVTKGEYKVTVDLPFYQTLSSYMMDNGGASNDTAELQLGTTKQLFGKKNHSFTILVGQEFAQYKKVDICDRQGQVIKSFELKQ